LPVLLLTMMSSSGESGMGTLRPLWSKADTISPHGPALRLLPGKAFSSSAVLRQPGTVAEAAMSLRKRLKIAQVAPLYESGPPKQCGGTERVVSYLTEELVRLGHDVTLFASGDSETAARLVAPCPRSLRTDPHCIDYMAAQMILLDQVFEQAVTFDLIHF